MSIWNIFQNRKRKTGVVLCGLEEYPRELPPGDKPLLPSCCSDSNGDRSPSAIAKIWGGGNSNLRKVLLEEVEKVEVPHLSGSKSLTSTWHWKNTEGGSRNNTTRVTWLGSESRLWCTARSANRWVLLERMFSPAYVARCDVISF